MNWAIRNFQFVLTIVVLAQFQVASASAEPEITDDESSISDDDLPDETEAASTVPTATSPIFWAARSMDMRFGLTFNSGDNYCTKLHATLPFPMTWPEQQVELIDFVLPDYATYYLRPSKLGVGEIVLDLERMSPNDTLDVYANVRINKSFIKAPEDTESLQFARKPQSNKKLAVYLGDSPFIETKSRQIRQIATELREAEPANAWKHVESIYDWVRTTIKYEAGNLRSTTQALRDGKGDCEEMTSLFIAICRASDIPARVVWVPEHCYPEFYLENSEGTGAWYPCQISGDRQFGEMNEYRPILQKGDRFKTPEQPKFQRYLAEFFTCKMRSTGSTGPSIQPIQDLGPLRAEMDAQQSTTP